MVTICDTAVISAISQRTTKEDKIKIMARGWESKSVEEQQSEVLAPANQKRENLSVEQRALENIRNGLVLNQKRVQQQLAAARNSHHREMLEAALADLVRQIAKLKQGI